MKLTKKKAIELHRNLWDWLYYHPSKEKADWFDLYPEYKKEMEKYDCFPCEYTNQDCENCILEWPNNETCFVGEDFSPNYNSPYWKWANGCLTTRKKYAKIIRDLPERK